MHKPKTDQVTVRAVSFEIHASETEIGFPTPGADLANDPRGHEYIWKLIQYVFQLPDPASMPSIDDANLDAAQLAALYRFCREAEDLARSPFLSYPTSMDVKVDQNEETVTANFPPSENERGFAVHLRQFLGPEERAGFRKVYNIAWTANDSTADSKVDDRRAILQRWMQVEKKLRNRTPNAWVALKLAREGKLGEVPNMDAPPVEKLVSAFSYGHLIHWGKRAEEFERLTQSPFDDAHNRMLLYKGMAGLAHLYIGFSVLLTSLIPELRSE